MKITLDTAQAFILIFASIIATLVSLTILGAWTRKKFQEFVNDAVAPRLASIESDLAEVHHEVLFNNGSSLKDMTREIMKAQDRMEIRLDQIEGKD